MKKTLKDHTGFIKEKLIFGLIDLRGLVILQEMFVAFLHVNFQLSFSRSLFES